MWDNGLVLTNVGYVIFLGLIILWILDFARKAAFGEGENCSQSCHPEIFYILSKGASRIRYYSFPDNPPTKQNYLKAPTDSQISQTKDDINVISVSSVSSSYKYRIWAIGNIQKKKKNKVAVRKRIPKSRNGRSHPVPLPRHEEQEGSQRLPVPLRRLQPRLPLAGRSGLLPWLVSPANQIGVPGAEVRIRRSAAESRFTIGQL